MEAVEMKTVDNSLTCPNIDKNFWKNKKVLVTGCTGFKGSWLVTWLLEMGANIYGYSLTAPTNPSMFELLGLKNKINYKIGNVCDYTLFSEFLNQANPEIVFHLAAQPLVRYSYINPIETYSTNVLGLVHVLEAIRQNKQVKAVVNVTSDKCYENKEWHWGYRENEAMGGYDPYSNSKGCAELVTSCYRNSYFNVQEYGKSHNILLASGRAGNVIGGGDWAADRLIVDIMHSFLNNSLVKIRNPLAIRPWQHVLEPLSAYLLLAQKLYNGDTIAADGWNIGPHDTDIKNVEYIVNRLCDLWGAKWEEDATDHPHEANFLKLDCSRARELLGWTPRWNLDTTLNKIIQWYKSYISKEGMYKVTIEQINNYIES
ncbi:MAG: CDP-glucose 4,6-dehydratase [Burkholderiales bacterium]|jgi:CDP-glucose 4,6-dehydratase|nr:CDP-glucose 4,6-dehydratase [Burkholderiales bacterium]